MCACVPARSGVRPISPQVERGHSARIMCLSWSVTVLLLGHGLISSLISHAEFDCWCAPRADYGELYCERGRRSGT